MTGIDTNVLVRYFAQDEPVQSALATQLIERLTPEDPGFVSTVALVETVWVLTRAYDVPRPRIAVIVEGLLRSKELVVENAEVHYLALGLIQAAAVDFADAVISQSARRAGCVETVTFDRRAAAAGTMRLLGPPAGA